jgi:hypothetical protein
VEGIGAMPAYLQGSANRNMFPSATFKTTYPEAGTFAVSVGKVAKAGASLTILVDGTIAAQQSFKASGADSVANATVEAKVPAGDHAVRIENSGEDWLTIRRITLTPYGPALGALGKAAKDYAVFWLTNRQEKADGVKGKLTVPGLQAASYKVTWWDTSTGKPTGDETVAATGNTLTVSTPAVASDVVVTISRAGDKSASKPAKEKAPKKGKAM